MSPEETLDALERAATTIRRYANQVTSHPELRDSTSHRNIEKAMEVLIVAWNYNFLPVTPGASSSATATTKASTAMKCPKCGNQIDVTVELK